MGVTILYNVSLLTCSTVVMNCRYRSTTYCIALITITISSSGSATVKSLPSSCHLDGTESPLEPKPPGYVPLAKGKEHTARHSKGKNPSLKPNGIIPIIPACAKLLRHPGASTTAACARPCFNISLHELVRTGFAQIWYGFDYVMCVRSRVLDLVFNWFTRLLAGFRMFNMF